ncbi:MAG: hypothetical protein HEQ19_06895 [Gloeotrichia echinulata CP02]
MSSVIHRTRDWGHFGKLSASLGIGDWGHFGKLSASLGIGDWGKFSIVHRAISLCAPYPLVYSLSSK